MWLGEPRVGVRKNVLLASSYPGSRIDLDRFSWTSEKNRNSDVGLFPPRKQHKKLPAKITAHHGGKKRKMAFTRPPPTREPEHLRGGAYHERSKTMSSALVYLGIRVSLHLVYQNRGRTTCPVRRSMVLTTGKKRRCCRTWTGLPAYNVLLHCLYERFTAGDGDHTHFVALVGFDFDDIAPSCVELLGGEKCFKYRGKTY